MVVESVFPTVFVSHVRCIIEIILNSHHKDYHSNSLRIKSYSKTSRIVKIDQHPRFANVSLINLSFRYSVRDKRVTPVYSFHPTPTGAVSEFLKKKYIYTASARIYAFCRANHLNYFNGPSKISVNVILRLPSCAIPTASPPLFPNTGRIEKAYFIL